MLTSGKARTAGSAINTLILEGSLRGSAQYDHPVAGESRSTPLQPRTQCVCITADGHLTNPSPSERLNYGVLDGNEVELWGYMLLSRPRFRYMPYVFVCLKALVDHAHAMVLNFLSVLPMGGKASANDTDRILTWIGQITSITPLHVAFRAFAIQSYS